IAREPTHVVTAQRTAVVIAILGAPSALFVASLASQIVREAPTIAALSLAAGVAIGLVAIPLARPLGPEHSRWTDAIHAAVRAAERADTHDAVAAALAELAQVSGRNGAAPELFRIDPPELITVDRAGYAHARDDVRAPAELYTLAEGEPERTLSTPVLATLE